jgi:hypothetical protein
MRSFVSKFKAYASRFPDPVSLSNPSYFVGDDNDLKKLIKYVSSKRKAKCFPFYHFKIYEGAKVAHSFQGKD